MIGPGGPYFGASINNSLGSVWLMRHNLSLFLYHSLRKGLEASVFNSGSLDNAFKQQTVLSDCPGGPYFSASINNSLGCLVNEAQPLPVPISLATKRL